MAAERATKHYITFGSLVVILVVILSTAAQAELFDIWGVVENNSFDPVTDQLSVDVTPGPGLNQVKFTFINAPGGDPSSITGIYFDDGTLFGIASIVDSPPSVDFTHPATSPAELKGANTVDPPFETTTGFSAQSGPPPYHDGVNPGESVAIVFDLADDEFGDPFTVDDVIAAIELGFGYPADPDDENDPWFTDSLRIGVNVQGIGPDDKSDSYILVPVPASVVLSILGLGVVGWKLRKYA